jgi:hypothetical protein
MSKLKTGELVRFSTGEYGDYSAGPLFEALQDFNVGEQRDEYIKEHPDESEQYHADFDAFVSFLETKNLIKCVHEPKATIVWLGAYATWSTIL